MGKIIAIGGGEIGRPGTKVETTAIDKEIIKISGKKKPSLLFLPTASNDSESYYNVVKKHFGDRLGCKTNVLYLTKNKYSQEELETTILNSDIIYVGGGNTLKMMNIWKKFGVDKILKEAYEKGVVLSGISAGAICWFKYGNSDSLKFSNSKAKMIRVKGLNIINMLLCPHYNVEKHREYSLKKMMKTTKEKSIALDNCSAIEIIDDKFRIIYSQKGANAYFIYWNKLKFNKILIKKSKIFLPIKFNL